MKIRVALVALVLSFAAAGPHVASATTDTTPPGTETPVTDAPPVTDNEFIPENVNIGDCLSSLPRPECGSKNRSGTGTLLTFGALLAGTGFIGWRVSRSVRARDREMNG